MGDWLLFCWRQKRVKDKKSHTCKTVSQNCRICGTTFRTAYGHVLCKKCRNKLPKCSVCGMIMAPEYGYLERYGGTIGNKKLCGSCYRQLRKRGRLHITADQDLLRDGQVVRVPLTLPSTKVQGFSAQGLSYGLCQSSPGRGDIPQSPLKNITSTV